jgi:hypothetical protein
VLEHLAKIAAVDPATTICWTADEMLRLSGRRIAESLSRIFSAGEVVHLDIALKGERAGAPTCYPLTKKPRGKRARSRSGGTLLLPNTFALFC